MKNPKIQGLSKYAFINTTFYLYDTVKLLTQCFLYDSDGVRSPITGTYFFLLFWLSSPVSCASNEMSHLKVLTFSFKYVLACSHPYWVSSGRTCNP